MLTLQNRVSALLADPIETVVRDFNRRVLGGDELAGSIWRNVAPVSMWEDSGLTYLAMDVPGIPLENLNISFEKGKLTIKADRPPVADAPMLHDERFHGQFERHITLTDEFDASTFQATLADGVLQIKMAKKPEAQPQRIAITPHTPGAKRLETSV